jgi:hypothetical protein
MGAAVPTPAISKARHHPPCRPHESKIETSSSVPVTPILGISFSAFPLDRVRTRFQITRLFPGYWNQFSRGRGIAVPGPNRSCARGDWERRCATTDSTTCRWPRRAFIPKGSLPGGSRWDLRLSSRPKDRSIPLAPIPPSRHPSALNPIATWSLWRGCRPSDPNLQRGPMHRSGTAMGPCSARGRAVSAHTHAAQDQGDDRGHDGPHPRLQRAFSTLRWSALVALHRVSG